jgi:hypothetical protein
MRRNTVLGLLVLLVMGLATPAGAIEVETLLGEPDEWNGRAVRVQGELVGDYGRHDGAVWVQLNDDPYVDAPLLETEVLAGGNVSIALRVPTVLIEPIMASEPPGGYRRRGAVVAVVGTFLYHDPERYGETYIQVTSIEITEPGRDLPSEPTGPWGAMGAVLAAIAAGLHLIYARQRRRQRRLET